MKKQYLSLLLLLFLVFSLFSCTKDDKSETATQNDVVLLYNNVKIIDSLSLSLNMDNTLLDQGKYEFSFTGNVPNITTGDIIVGAQGDGFIRKVISTTVNGNRISLQTTQGSMSNVFRDGKFKLVLNSESGRNSSPSLGNFSHTFNNQNLFQSGIFSLVLDQGMIDYNSNWVFDFEFENLGLKYFEMGLTNATLNATMTTTLTASQSVNLLDDTVSLIQGPREMWTKTFLVPAVLVGVPVLVPVKINVDYDVLLNYATTIDAELSRSGTFTSNNELNLGIKYSEGQWTDLNSFNTNSGFSLSSYNGNANITSNLSITPRFDVKLYGLLGPYLIAGPKCEFAGNVHLPLTPFSDSDFEINGSLISSLGAEIKILDETLVDKSLGPFETSKVSLYKLPSEISKVSGDNQMGAFSQPLQNNLKVKVIDSQDLPCKNTSVHFKIEDGNGNFAGENEKIVLTDNQGFASISWTLGNSGSQKVSAKVLKADGTNITASPNEFMAIGNSECDDIYQTVTIGSQIWMQKNLNVCKYRNGDDIPQVTDPNQWAYLTTGAWCYYVNNTENGPVYGKLYNWYAVNDPRGLAPAGYHVSNNTEWGILVTYLGGESAAGGKMKATALWNIPNTDDTNSSGFSGLPGGFRNGAGTFYYIGTNGYWWSSTEYSTALAWFHGLFSSEGLVGSYPSKTNGFSVRCLRD